MDASDGSQSQWPFAFGPCPTGSRCLPGSEAGAPSHVGVAASASITDVHHLRKRRGVCGP